MDIEFWFRFLCLMTLAYIAVQDATHFRIPDPAILFLASLGALRMIWADEIVLRLGAGLVAGALFWLLALAYARLRRRDGLGLGDVKLAGVMGLWLGLETGMAILVGTVSALGVTGLTILRHQRSRDDPIPLGTFLAFGFAVVLIL